MAALKVAAPSELVLLGGHVTRTARDRFAALARERRQTVAAYLRDIVESLTGEAPPSSPPSGSVRRLTLRLGDHARAKLIEIARARRSTPTGMASVLLEAVLEDRPSWSTAEKEELRALYVELKAVEVATSDPAVLDPLRVAMLRVLRNVGRLEGK